MWQWLLIAPLVAASAAYAAWRLVPGTTRWRFARWFSRRAAHGPAWLARAAQRLERAALPAGGCDACPATRVAPGAPRRPAGR
jgi:hypothetical protein